MGSARMSSEDEVEDKASKVVAETSGTALIYFGWADIDRLMTFCKVAAKNGRDLVISPKEAYLLDKLKGENISGLPELGRDNILILDKMMCGKKNLLLLIRTSVAMIIHIGLRLVGTELLIQVIRYAWKTNEFPSYSAAHRRGLFTIKDRFSILDRLFHRNMVLGQHNMINHVLGLPCITFFGWPRKACRRCAKFPYHPVTNVLINLFTVELMHHIFTDIDESIDKAWEKFHRDLDYSAKLLGGLP